MKNKSSLMFILKLIFVLLVFILVLLSLVFINSIFNLGSKNKNKTTKSENIILEKKYDVTGIKKMTFNFKNFEVEYSLIDGNELIIKQEGIENKLYVDSKKTKKKISVKESVLDIFEKKKYYIYIPRSYTGTIKIKNGYGKITINDLNSIKLDNNSGNVEINNVNIINIVNVSGSVFIKGKADKIIAYSTIGDMIISEIGTSCNIETITGDISINEFNVSDNSKVETTSGNISMKIGDNSNCKLTHNKNDAYQITNSKCIDGLNVLKVKNVTGNVIIK